MHISILNLKNNTISVYNDSSVNSPYKGLCYVLYLLYNTIETYLSQKLTWNRTRDIIDNHSYLYSY